LHAKRIGKVMLIEYKSTSPVTIYQLFINLNQLSSGLYCYSYKEHVLHYERRVGSFGAQFMSI